MSTREDSGLAEGASSASSVSPQPASTTRMEHVYLGMLQSTKTSNAAHQMTPLAKDFMPSADDVICGRGKKCYSHIGNDKFRRRVIGMLDEYSRAKSKLDKSGVLSKVMAEVRRASPAGGFVKQDESGQWYEVGDFLAREKTSQAFRDALHERYKSSNVSKKKRRQKEHVRATDHAHRIARSEQEVSRRLERISNELIVNANFEFASRVHGLPPRHPSQSISTHLSDPTQFPDPLFGNTVGVPVNAPPIVPYTSTTPATHSFMPPQRTQSMPASLLHPRVSSMFSEHESMHNSAPLFHFRNPIQRLSVDVMEADIASMNRPHPDFGHIERQRIEHDISSPGFGRIQPTRALEPAPVDLRSDPTVYPKLTGYDLKDPPEDQDLKRPAFWPKTETSNEAEPGHSKDLLACLEKLTEHSISDGNPFEPIPIAADPDNQPAQSEQTYKQGHTKEPREKFSHL